MLATVAIAIVGCDQGASQGQPAAAKSQEAIDVHVSPISRRDVQRGIDVTGTLYPDDQAQIAAKTPGRIIEVLKDVGDVVAPGELIAQVDRTDYKLLVQQREAAVSEALSRLGIESMPGSEFDLTSLPAVQRAAAQERNALARFERGKELFESDPPLISEQDYADLETSYEVAQHNVKAEMLASRTLLLQARSRATDLDIARQQLNDTEIRAPQRAGLGVGYLVAARSIAIGEHVERGDTAFTLVDNDPIKFRADAPERYAGVVKIGQKVRLNVDAFSKAFEGTVTRLSPQVDAQSRTFQFEAEIANAAGELTPGSFAVGVVETQLQRGVLFVPSSAVVTFAGVKRIFSIVDDKAVEHRVQTGLTIDGEIEIVASNVSKDAIIVMKDAHRLVHGATVTVTMEAAKGSDAGATETAALGTDSR